MNRDSVFVAMTRFGILLFALGIPISHVPAQAGIGMAVLGWLGEGLFNKKWSVQWHPAFVPLIGYLGWNAISSALSERPGHSLGAILDNEWPLIIMLMLYWTIEEEAFLKKVVTVFLCSACIAVAYAVWQVVGGVELYRHMALDEMGSGLYRAVGFYSFYLTFAALAMAVFFFATSFSFELKRWYFVVVSVLSVLAVIGTFARSMWLAFAVGIPIFAFTRSRRFGTILTSLILVVVVGGMLTVPTLRYRIESILDPGQNETRLNLWKTAMNVSEANPIFGVGEDNWDLVFDRFRVDGYYDTTVHPHNDYLTVLVSSGVPGLLAFMSTWCVILVTGMKSATRMQSKTLRSVAWGGAFSLVGLLVGAMFQNYYGTFINCLEWWFVAGLLMTAAKLNVPPPQEVTPV
jgi:putative inorganic carbon (HCO3(-)) transporter